MADKAYAEVRWSVLV